ncbi:MAG: hypothetical protein CBB68_06575 [Rhodospirillaceae bacterium TMED8]|nr:hypothetical protein [Magnetovibrio sp.]OUT51280.1 MAG: hypothetical protein CBB68_06575 [Rhodospirillaceae bacterium TMED8]
MTRNSFHLPEDVSLSEEFLRNGYVILRTESEDELARMQNFVACYAATKLGLAEPHNAQSFLDNIADHISVDKLNDFRLDLIDVMNAQAWMRPLYLSLARSAINNIVGNELSMQRRINLSIQIPDDDSSLLPVHADVWSGDSPFEVVLWVPLVDCASTKSMYLMPPREDREIQAQLAAFNSKSSEDLFAAIEPFAKFLEVPFGHVLLFSQTLMHGNRVNIERKTRWSMNCRFKSVFSPYADKKLGEFFEPVTLRANTRFAMQYELPRNFDE